MAIGSAKNICIKSIMDLRENPDDDGKPYRFFIPAYQRGYRWGEEEVKTLLDDIHFYFEEDNDLRNSGYCLQPIVVRRRHDGSYEVIDGQQRLTTLFILNQFADILLYVQGVKSEYFSIEYESRPSSREFLQSLQITSEVPESDLNNPDYYYMHSAFKTIAKWYQDNRLTPQKSYDSYLGLLKRLCVIWYEVPEGDESNPTDSVDLFRKINMGKIPLTNAELIKGLMLSKANMAKAYDAYTISSEWDRIEHRLQNEEFWYFLTNRTDSYLTRIDLILDIWLRHIPGHSGSDSKKRYAVFNYVYNNPEWDPATMWRECKEIFANLEYWYENRELYHLIGYLIASNTEKGAAQERILSLYSRFSALDKTALRTHLVGEIARSLRCVPEEIETLNYHDDRSRIRNILLLFNLLTINETKSSTMRFPFDLYKKDKWDLEHIHATAGGPPTDAEVHKWDVQEDAGKSRELFFRGLLSLLKDLKAPQALTQKIESFIQDGNFKEQHCTGFWEEHRHDLSNALDDQDSIGNLALLSSKVNRSYGKASFLEKRRTIIEADRTTTFVPPCTKNAFLKYYTDNPSDFTFWSETDRVSYVADIKRVLANYFGLISTNGMEEQA